MDGEDALDELMPFSPDGEEQQQQQQQQQQADGEGTPSLDHSIITSPDSSIFGTLGGHASATKTKGLGRNLQGYGISQRTKGSKSSVAGSPSRSRDLLATPRNNRARDPLDLYSPMRYGAGMNATRNGSNVGTPARRLIRHDVGDGMEIPHRGVVEGEGELYIWGTNIDINETKNNFRIFLETFEKTPGMEGEGDEDEAMDSGRDEEKEANFKNLETGKFYLDVFLKIAVLEEKPQLNLNCKHLKEANEKLYQQLIAYPQEVIPVFDISATEVFCENFPAKILPAPIQVRPFNLDKPSVMRQMNPEDIDRLVSIHGMVIRTSTVVPELRDVMFMCSVCEDKRHEEIHRGKITEPTLCENCHSTHSYGVMHNLSRFSDVQIVKLQESQEDMPPGQTPHTILVYVHDSLVDTVQAGDRIIVTGVYRAVPIRLNPRQQTIRAVYKTNIDVVHFQRKDKRKLSDLRDSDEDRLNMAPERIAEIQALAQDGDIYEKLSRAVAPSIYECDDIKKGVLLQLLGGTSKDFSNLGRGRPRSEINILLCGDPGTSKSQMLQYVHKIAPRGQYTSGKGSSAVGLTAYVTRDPDTRQFTLQSGALVLSDNGVCCIDEFDKMNEGTRSVLHEVMEQQTLSVAKAGIICQLNARTSILAAANPLESQWNKEKTIIENIQLPHTLLSRFDLIFLVLDPQDEVYDKRLARHLVSIYYRSEEESQQEEVSTDLLKDYIMYARHLCKPVLNDEAGAELVTQYVEMRRVGRGRGQISAYPRQLESLIRLSEARAKVRLEQVVTRDDVKEAIRLHREAMKQAATDPTTGKIDMGILMTGISAGARQRRLELSSRLRDFLQTKLGPGTYPHSLVFEQFRDASTMTFTRDQFEDALRELGEGVIMMVGRNIRVS